MMVYHNKAGCAMSPYVKSSTQMVTLSIVTGVFTKVFVRFRSLHYMAQMLRLYICSFSLNR